ncbi:MAG: DNA-binding protein [Desulfurococcales archaeon]|nr:DNA-binding protein [Desulfurococcales archaeon]
MSYDEELEMIKRRKLMELQRRLQEEERQRQIRLQKEILLRRILAPKARERLANLRLVKPELATVIEDQLIALAQAGRIRIPISDEELKEFLVRIYEQTHRETRIKIREK